MTDTRPFHWEYHPEAPPPEAFRIEGGKPLRGTVRVSGAKNAALKLLAAAVLTGERCRFENVPEIQDVRVLTAVLQDLGVVVDHPADGVYEIAAGDVDWLFIPLEAAAKMRASFILLGPLLARFGHVIISNPGGDRIGRRPVNFHVDAMRALGAEVDYRNGYYFAKAPGRLRGAEITFPQVTVMGTENAMLAACLADGTTVIRPAAQEPEVDDLIVFLGEMGADVARTAPDTIVVHGRRRLRGANHTVMPDRIETATFLVAAAVTGGQLTLENAACNHVGALVEIMGLMGVPVACGRTSIEIDATGLRPGDLVACDIETGPYPGLATDVQPPACVLLTQASGSSRVHETVFEDRIEWLAELRKLGARIEIVDAHHASIQGPTRLHGAEVSISDLRAGASLILAALAADGPSLIHGAHHVRRGYENIDRKFQQLGASIVWSADSA
jgi:UDP-N-acetylglucosamine 1-carboxyvinyltransferase